MVVVRLSNVPPADGRLVPPAERALAALCDFAHAIRTAGSLHHLRGMFAILEGALPAPPVLDLSGTHAIFPLEDDVDPPEIAPRATRHARQLRVPVRVHGAPIGTISIVAAGVEQDEVLRAERILTIAAAMLGKELTDRQAAATKCAVRPIRSALPPAQSCVPKAHVPVDASTALHEIWITITDAALSDRPVLIRGETGTEKLQVALTIHRASAQASKPFVAVDGADNPDARRHSESVLTANRQVRLSVELAIEKLEQSGSGTLFVDDVCDLSSEAQANLARLARQCDVERARGTRHGGLDARLIAATSKRVEDLVGSGSFRRDLYYALTSLSVWLPPLRQRKHDIALLAEQYLAQSAACTGTKVSQISAQAMKALALYAWPYNVRELEECLGHALRRAKGSDIYKRHLPRWVLTALPGAEAAEAPEVHPVSGACSISRWAR